MKNRTVTNVAGQSLEIVIKSGGVFQHIQLNPGKSIIIPEKSLTDICLELQRRQLLQII
jgi:hypothetical protein